MTETLTGRRRYRVMRKWGREKLVLQVEVTSRETSFIGGYVDHFNWTRWRDATTADLTTTEVVDE